eukprot:870640-Rhodomonas_salina.4
MQELLLEHATWNDGLLGPGTTVRYCHSVCCYNRLLSLYATAKPCGVLTLPSVPAPYGWCAMCGT